MDLLFDSQHISYAETGRFSKITLDYLNEDEDLKPFFKYKTNLEGIRSALENKKKHPVNRQLLFEELTRQYAGITDADKLMKNIGLLLDENTFTVCTAHQPNLFTGHLYFIYKIIHVIKLADHLTKEIPGHQFVPVFFVGSEDADLDELNHIYVDGKKYLWNTSQTGAVGRMTVDKDLVKLITELEGQLLAEPFGKEVIDLLKKCYIPGSSIEKSTFLFVHELFKHFGLIVFLPDNAAYKREMLRVFEEDIFKNTPGKIVNETSKRLSQHHHAQAFARDINLFYMKDDIRNRIVKVEGRFVVHETGISFSEDEMKNELQEHPERFSPNVILRGLFQESVLPNLIFVGGGGELAYWLQLKDLFDHFKTPYPVLFLRNSLLLIEKKWDKLIKKLGVGLKDIFLNEEKLFQFIVHRDSKYSLSLNNESEQFNDIFDSIRKRAAEIDKSLIDHILSLKAKQQKKILAVEKKFVSAEKKKNEATGRQIHKLLESLFPGAGLQERTENFMLFYAKWGASLFDHIYEVSPLFEPSFSVLTEVDEVA